MNKSFSDIEPFIGNKLKLQVEASCRIYIDSNIPNQFEVKYVDYTDPDPTKILAYASDYDFESYRLVKNCKDATCCGGSTCDSSITKATILIYADVIHTELPYSGIWFIDDFEFISSEQCK